MTYIQSLLLSFPKKKSGMMILSQEKLIIIILYNDTRNVYRFIWSVSVVFMTGILKTVAARTL